MTKDISIREKYSGDPNVRAAFAKNDSPRFHKATQDYLLVAAQLKATVARHVYYCIMTDVLI
jgi:hypothetical protein